MTQPQWSSLYTQHPGGRETIASVLTSALETAGAAKYDPFGLVPGQSYPRAVKLFVAPPVGTWVRLIPSPDCLLEPVVSAVSSAYALLMAEIGADLAPSLAVYKDGVRVDTMSALAPMVSEPEAFLKLLRAPRAGAAGIGGISSGALPSNVRAMSSGLPTRQVERLMSSMTGALSKSERSNAQAALQSVDWDSGAGAWMRELLAFLGLETHAALDYATISTAVRTAKRLARNPQAMLYPGDAEARDAVPDALDYLPIFYGWKA